MNDAMYDLIRESFFDLDRLDMIAQQIDLLDCQGKFVFSILQNGFKISNFYFDSIFVLPDYWTSIRSNSNRTHWSKEESDLYAIKENTYNGPYHNVFLSAVSMYNDNMLIMEHNDKLNNDEITRLEALVSQQNEEHQRMVDELLETLESELMNKHD